MSATAAMTSASILDLTGKQISRITSSKYTDSFLIRTKSVSTTNQSWSLNGQLIEV